MKEENHLYVLGLYGAACSLVSLVALCLRSWFVEQAKFRTDLSQHRLIRAVNVVIVASVYYAISVYLTLFNKWFYSYWRGGFNLPISATACHMIVKAIVAHCLVSSRLSPYYEEPYDLHLRDTVLIIAPIGMATAGDVVLSNVSFTYITVSLYTVVKSGSLLWILFWGVLLGLEVCSARLAAICAAVSVGLGLASYTATPVSWVGVALVLGAGGLGGLRESPSLPWQRLSHFSLFNCNCLILW